MTDNNKIVDNNETPAGKNTWTEIAFNKGEVDKYCLHVVY